ncbi:hypothetical protein SAMN05216486_11039 [bacterium JGI 053]|nr:hypothetical protein SAMN05216486_11039 [bacterium JGI 053]
MGQAIELPPLRECDLDILYGPGMEQTREAFDDALLVLVDLFQRHTGSWFGIQIPEEERAIEILEDRLSLMPQGDPFRGRVLAGMRAYQRLREECARTGPSAATKDVALRAIEKLREQLTALTDYPEFGSAGERTAAAG